MRTVCRLKKHLDSLANEKGFKKTFMRDKIAESAGVSPRQVNKWLNGSQIPNVIHGQIVAEWVSQMVGSRVGVGDIWPVQEKSA